VFLLPAGVRTIIGTTDTDWTPRGQRPRPAHPGDAITARASDVEYLLEVANAAFPTLGLTPDDVVSTFAGLRPLVAVPAHTVSATSREHELIVEPDGLLTIIGGKLTTYRRMAQEVVDAAIERLRDQGHEHPVAPCSTADRPLPGGQPEPPDVRVAEVDVDVPPDVERHLRRTYGARTRQVLSCISEMQEATAVSGKMLLLRSARVAFTSRMVPDLPYCWGEVLYTTRHEMVNEVEDVLKRRIPLFRDARDQGMAAAPLVAEIMGDVLGWSAERRAQSLGGYKETVARSATWKRSTGE
jgi:glycerol-3-phosphate dehydrogenase